MPMIQHLDRLPIDFQPPQRVDVGERLTPAGEKVRRGLAAVVLYIMYIGETIRALDTCIKEHRPDGEKWRSHPCLFITPPNTVGRDQCA